MSAGAGGIRIGVAGAAGRIGGELVKAILADCTVSLGGALVRKGSAAEGKDIGETLRAGACGVIATADAKAFVQAVDVMVDLSLPKATEAHVAAALAARRPLVMGTTGIEAEGQHAIAEAAKIIPIARVPSASVGMAVLTLIVERAARALGAEYDAEVLNQQHRKKADAPSGGALSLGAAAARGRGIDLSAAAIIGRDGETGPRPKGAIGFSSVAGGEGIVEHGIMFLGDGESIAFTHRGAGRAIYTGGLIKAAFWLKDRKPGLYSMADVLDLG
jgi:4-hydroxy-tetrahydrodipicolinate reductase